MGLTTMYPGMSNSPKTTLKTAIAANATSIEVNDSSVLPEAPNIAVIGNSASAEVVIYSGKNGNILTGLIRGAGGTTAGSWAVDTVVARNFTLLDYDAIRANIQDLDARKRESTDPISLEEAVSGTLPVEKGGTGVTTLAAIKTLLGLGALAYKAAVNLASDITGTLGIGHGGTGLTASPSLLVNLGSGDAANILQASPRPGVTGTLPVAKGGTGQTTLAAFRNALGLGNGTGALPVANGGTGLSASPSMLTNLGSTTAANVLQASPRPGVTGTLAPGNGGTGQTSLQAARNAMGLGNTTGALPVANGGTGSNAAAGARTNLGITGIATKPDYTISTTDLVDGTSALDTNKLYFVYE